MKKKERLLTDFHRHLTELVVVGFNSGKYDLNVLKDILIPHLVHRSGIDLAIKRHHAYLALNTGALKFEDISNFVAAGTSYAGFLKAYQCQGEKGFFPYEHVRSLSQLEEPRLPPREAFHSWLRKSEDDYAVCQRAWTAYEFHGCYWHGHRCWLTAKKFASAEADPDSPQSIKSLKLMRERAKRTEDQSQYLESPPELRVVSIRECQWYHQKWADKQRDIETFLNQHFPGRSEKKQTQGQLLQRVQEGTFFGALEVDIDTPPHLRASSGK